MKVLWSLDTKGTMDIYLIPGGAQSRALIEKGSCSTKKSNSVRGIGRGKRLPVPTIPTVGLRHRELSRVTEPTLKINEPAEEVPTSSRTRHPELSRMTEPTLKINEPAEEVPTSSRTRHPELSRMTEPVTKGKAEPHPWDRYAPAADVYIYPAENFLDTIEMVAKTYGQSREMLVL